jgi:hypothetical protein
MSWTGHGTASSERTNSRLYLHQGITHTSMLDTPFPLCTPRGYTSLRPSHLEVIRAEQESEREAEVAGGALAAGEGPLGRPGRQQKGLDAFHLPQALERRQLRQVVRDRQLTSRSTGVVSRLSLEQCH